MPFIKPKCATCGKVADVVNEHSIGERRVLSLKCGHLIVQDKLTKQDASQVISMDGKTLYPFQVKSVEFLENASGRALLAHEMGLGKTVCVQALLAMHPELNPTLYIVKSSLKVQWSHEIMRWQGENAFAQIIETSRSPFFPNLTAYIISFDLIPRFSKCQLCNHDAHNAGACVHRRKGALNCNCKVDSSDRPNFLKKEIERLGIKTVIIDECQQIKNTDADRTMEIRRLCKDVDNVICLSGTPIKNNAAEYFSVLNILKPEMFSNKARFVSWDCDSYYNGYSWKSGGLRDPEGFKRKTESFILRYERAEVLPDLPMITRNFLFSELGEAVEKAYIETFKQFRDEYNSSSNGSKFEEASNMLAYLSRMRHLTGLSKIDPCIDHVMEFLGSTERKITIFVHHKDVGEVLRLKLTKLLDELNIPAPLVLVSELNSDQRARVVHDFMEGDARVLIASTLASGEGLNLQNCSDCIMLERQWNPANEEQAEGRFIRIGQKANKVTGTYLVAIGTVDEFFSELVERKREIVKKTLGGEAVEWDQSSLMKELSEILASNGGQKWGI